MSINDYYFVYNYSKSTKIPIPTILSARGDMGYNHLKTYTRNIKKFHFHLSNSEVDDLQRDVNRYIQLIETLNENSIQLVADKIYVGITLYLIPKKFINNILYYKICDSSMRLNNFSFIFEPCQLIEYLWMKYQIYIKLPICYFNLNYNYGNIDPLNTKIIFVRSDLDKIISSFNKDENIKKTHGFHIIFPIELLSYSGFIGYQTRTYYPKNIYE